MTDDRAHSLEPDLGPGSGRPAVPPASNPRGLSRRAFLRAAAGAGVGAVIISTGWPDGYAWAAGTAGSLGSGTVPEQVHLTWGSDPSSAMTVSWVSPQASANASLVLTGAGGGSAATYSAAAGTVTARSYTDGPSGETVYAYHVPLTGLTPGATYDYAVEDAGATTPVTFSSSFTMAGVGRFPFSFTSFGDLATPGAGAVYTLADGSTLNSTTYSESQWNAYTAVSEVEVQAPLFHLLNGDLCYADKKTGPKGGSGVQNAPEVWRDFGLNVQRSAANRPWMPCIGNHEAELDNGPYGYASFNARFLLPGDGTAFSGNFYSFQVGSVLFIALDANDVVYQGSGAYNTYGQGYTDSQGRAVALNAATYNRQYTGQFGPPNADGTLPAGSNAQTAWLQETLANARSAGGTVDWIVVQMHQCAMSSSTDNGCDAGIRQTWLPLFAEYQVDLVLNGHDHDYERTYPVHGFTTPSGTGTWPGGTVFVDGNGDTQSVPANTAYQGDYQTYCPQPVAGYNPSSTVFNTSQGTVFLTLGGGGTNAPDNTYGSTAVVHTFTQVRTSSSGKPSADSTEPPVWSAKTDPTNSYGIALFEVNPGQSGGNTTMTVTYYDAAQQKDTGGNQPAPAYAPATAPTDSFTLTRPRSDSPGANLPEFADPALVLGAAAVLAGGALYLHQRPRPSAPAEDPAV